ncbi:MAG: nuclease [Fibrobacteres bacterium]|nr:nuclease [Fibrobacterota bacterium]
MRTLLHILILFAAMLGFRPASAFGVLGHQVIAALADDMLTPKAKAEVENLLGPAGGSTALSSIATWADDIRMLRSETRPWHYVTIQIGEARYDPARADSADVIKAINRQSAILANPAADRYAREEALKWVVHLVGDLHQPLHAGEDHDKGGNLAKVRVNRRTYNLHEVWDYVLLERLHLPMDSLRVLLEREIAADSGFIRRNAQGTVESWADDTHSKSPACYVLHGKPMRKGIKVQLDKAYVDAATLTVLSQLKIGGVRLAYALNRALDPHGAMPAPVLRAPPGWHAGSDAYFAGADPIRDIPEAGTGEDSISSRPAHPAKGAKGAAKGRARIPAGKYAWSVNSDIYHFSECADVARIKRKNLQTADFPPFGKRLHAGCPIPR